MEEQRKQDFNAEEWHKGYAYNYYDGEIIIDAIKYAGYFTFSAVKGETIHRKPKIFIRQDNEELLNKFKSKVNPGAVIKVKLNPLGNAENKNYELLEFEILKCVSENEQNAKLNKYAAKQLPENSWLKGVAINLEFNNFHVAGSSVPYSICFDFFPKLKSYYQLVQVFVKSENRELLTRCIKDLKDFSKLEVKLVKLNTEKIPAYELTDFGEISFIKDGHEKSKYIGKAKHLKDFFNSK